MGDISDCQLQKWGGLEFWEYGPYPGSFAFKIGRDEMKGYLIDMKGGRKRMYGFMYMAY